jgi:hypothetical protein
MVTVSSRLVSSTRTTRFLSVACWNLGLGDTGSTVTNEGVPACGGLGPNATLGAACLGRRGGVLRFGRLEVRTALLR